MKRSEFYTLSEENKRKKLRQTIINKTCGRLTEKNLDLVVNSADLDKQYEVFVTSNISVMTSALVLYNSITEYSLKREEGFMETGSIVVGNAIFGKYYFRQFVTGYDGTSRKETVHEYSHFNPAARLIVFKDQYFWENSEKLHSERTDSKIIIYLPNSK